MRGASADAGGCFPTGRHYPGIAHLVRARARGTANEFAVDTLMTDLPFVAIDVEATGLDPNEDRVIEVACVVFSRGEVERHGWLINPGTRPISEESRAVHNISDDDVRDAPQFAQVAAQIVEVLRRGVPLAYNAEFDRAFLMAEFGRVAAGSERPDVPALRQGVDWLDPLTWARELQQEEKSKSLSAVAERLGIEAGTAHRAVDDAHTAGRVLHAFFGDSRVPTNYAAFVQEQRRLGRVHKDERQFWRS
jgi:DNA polymerase-3 subunit epsilon